MVEAEVVIIRWNYILTEINEHAVEVVFVKKLGTNEFHSMVSWFFKIFLPINVFLNDEVLNFDVSDEIFNFFGFGAGWFIGIIIWVIRL